MGADENAETKSKAVEPSSLSALGQKLNDGWRVEVTTEGQLLLTPPSRYGEPESAA